METSTTDDIATRVQGPRLDKTTRWFLAVWRWLDDSRLRQVWPFALGGLLAFGAVQLTGHALWAAGIVGLAYYGLTVLARRAVAHEEALRKTRD